VIHAHKAIASIQVILKFATSQICLKIYRRLLSISPTYQVRAQVFAKQQEQLIAKQKREYRKHMCAEIMQAMLELDRNMHTSDVLQALADWATKKYKIPDETELGRPPRYCSQY